MSYRDDLAALKAENDALRQELEGAKREVPPLRPRSAKRNFALALVAAILYGFLISVAVAIDCEADLPYSVALACWAARVVALSLAVLSGIVAVACYRGGYTQDKEDMRSAARVSLLSLVAAPIVHLLLPIAVLCGAVVALARIVQLSGLFNRDFGGFGGAA